ncbi:MAG: hypothetical protein AAGF49_10535 [Pseudomonadota bacterium]
MLGAPCGWLTTAADFHGTRTCTGTPTCARTVTGSLPATALTTGAGHRLTGTRSSVVLRTAAAPPTAFAIAVAALLAAGACACVIAISGGSRGRFAAGLSLTPLKARLAPCCTALISVRDWDQIVV